jgi:hypothetical protein
MNVEVLILMNNDFWCTMEQFADEKCFQLKWSELKENLRFSVEQK